MAKNTDNLLLEYHPKFRKYRLLMRKRIIEILLVSSIYDSFILEEDARLSDQIYEEFHNLNLRTLPHVSRASSANQAIAMLKERKFDLVIAMRRIGELDPRNFAEKVKQIDDIPIILLLNNSEEIQSLKPNYVQDNLIDKVFVWNGNSNVFVAIIKLLEDRMNVDEDTRQGDVRVIIIVEDFIRFYSLYLPELYGEIMRQTRDLIYEGGNDYHTLLQMSSRPKILLAGSYEQALEYYKKYKEHLLGLITDIRFPRHGKFDDIAGFELVRAIRAEAPTLPIMMQSSEENNRSLAEDLQAYFVNKNDQSLVHELRNFMLEFMGFGSFTFRNPAGENLGEANNLFELKELIENIPMQSLLYHAKNDHFSGWLSARGEFEMARRLKPRKVSEFESDEDLRQFLLRSFDEILQEKLGVIVDFDRVGYHPNSRFVRLRPGSLGGKGRGLAFLVYLRSLFNAGFRKEFPNISIQVPKTFAIGTNEFEKFMQQNHLFDFVSSEMTDDQIKERFLHARISESLWSDLQFVFSEVGKPLAVRSSNIFEDSLFRPFAGVFSTYMIPNCNPHPSVRINQLVNAIKLVYASTYLSLAQAYADTLGVSLAGSRMAVVIQEVVGRQYGRRYYPNYSGTAASYNYYPVGDRLQPEDRIAYLALGLGKSIVDGGLTRRFSPKYPEINIYSDIHQKIDESQRYFYAIQRECHQDFDLHKGEYNFLGTFDLGDAIQDQTLTEIADTYNPNDGRFSSGYWEKRTGFPVITFDRQIKYNTFPLAQVINRVLQLGEEAMGCPVEIEFAGDFPENSNEKLTFNLLQIRPFVEHEETSSYVADVKRDNLFIHSSQISGNRVIKNIQDIVYIKPDSFDQTKTLLMAKEISQINQRLNETKTPFILIGPGRWGTNDRHLGVPVDWRAISGARVIIEVDLENFIVDHSQGSHFFHNIVSAGIPYMCVKYRSDSDYLDWEWLENMETISESTYFRHIRTTSPVFVIINSKKRFGQILKPGESEQISN